MVFSHLQLAAEAKKEKPCFDIKVSDCSENIIHYPLFDTDYKIAANYAPILGLRALSHGNIYRKKKKFHLERFFYVKDLTGKLGKPYESLIVDGEVKGTGLLSRRITAHGKLNEFDFEYINDASVSFTRKAKLTIVARVDKFLILDLEVNSKASDLSNVVKGSFFGKKVDYTTKWRDTDGILAGIPYKVHTQGTVYEDEEEVHASEAFGVETKGSIGEYEISGSGKMTTEGYYQTSESYGPIVVKTFITIIEN